MQLQSIGSILRTVPQINHPLPLQPSSEKKVTKKAVNDGKIEKGMRETPVE